MKLYSYQHGGQDRVGALRGDELIDLTAAGVASSMLDLIRAGDAALVAAQAALQRAGAGVPLSAVRLLAPIARPGKVLCSGVNYASHATENPKAVMPSEPFFFAKLPNAVCGPLDPISRGITRQLDYEVELAVVIGRALPRHSPPGAVMDAVFGYTLLNDVSARDVQFKDAQITLGKNFDGFAPTGPCIVTADELSEPGAVRLKTTLNGRVLQDGSTADWLFKLPDLIAALLRVMSLEAGDIVTTGTPAGVGVFQRPPIYMQPGDTVVIEAEGIGRLENPVVA